MATQRKSNGKNTSNDNGNGNVGALDVQTGQVEFGTRFASLISAARLLNDAEAKTRGQDPEISLQRSLTVFIRASGEPDGRKLSKEEKDAYAAAHKSYCNAYAQAKGVAVTVHGKAVDVRVTGERFAEFDKNGIPGARVRRIEARDGLTPGEKADYAAGRAAHFQRMEALLKQVA